MTAPGSPLRRTSGRRPSTPDPDDATAADATARRILAASDRSRSEVRRRLEDRGFSRPAATATVQRLAARGWIDDERLADDLAERRLGRGYGRRRVIADLVARGVGSETVNRIAAELGTHQAEAVKLAADRLRAGRAPGPPDEREFRRIAAALQRRGFEAADIRVALRRLAAVSGDWGD